MTPAVPRLRMFAGPNGSGKTTIKNRLRRPPSWFGIYINPDELEKSVREAGVLSLSPFGVTATASGLQEWFDSSPLLKSRNTGGGARISCHDGCLDFGGIPFNSYHASVLADYLRRRALDERKSFSFETVMSSEDKIGLLRDARAAGFRTYLYYVATEAPAINIQRVRLRVAQGGHDVPEDKIVSRYHRSLSLVPQAVRFADRAFFFDATGDQPWYFAEVTDGRTVAFKSAEVPGWFPAELVTT